MPIRMRVILVAFIVLVAMPVFAQPENRCVACHRNLPVKVKAGHAFRDWAISRHSRTGITCDQCHGGNPAGVEKKTAHLGILPSSNPKSKTHRRQIPKTCGICHFEEYVQFRGSKHSEHLENEGKAPHCVTCHNSMATSIITPEEMERRCGECHGGMQPWVKMLRGLNEASKSLGATQKKAWELMEAGKDTEKIETLLRIARDLINEVRPRWHRYKIQEISTKIRASGVILESANQHIEKLK